MMAIISDDAGIKEIITVIKGVEDIPIKKVSR